MREKNIAEPYFECFEFFSDRPQDLISDEIAASFSGLEFEMSLEPRHSLLLVADYNLYQLFLLTFRKKMSYYGRKLALGITGVILSTMSTSYLV